MDGKSHEIPDPRTDPRSNVFLGAILTVRSKSIPVRIRNLSVSGALIDGAGLAEEGDQVRLQRGSLAVDGVVAWLGGDQAGLRFDEPITVESWVTLHGHAGQRRVDMVVAAIRNDPTVLRERKSSQEHPTPLPVFGEELQQICERIAELPDISVALAEEVAKIEAIAFALVQRDGSSKP